MKRHFAWMFTCLMLIASITYAATIRVPADQPTIQAGIDAAQPGDTVLVADGTYTGSGNKNLDFKGKAITVTSENGPENCIIDCQGSGRGFNFHSRETAQSVLSGFTITNGSADDGGGIRCYRSSPTIEGNIIVGNSGNYGGGIYCKYSSAKIRNNKINKNRAAAQSGRGIFCIDSAPLIQLNEISHNYAFRGGGCYFSGSRNGDYPLVISNIITENEARTTAGGIKCGSSTIQNNTISRNKAREGGGIWSKWSSPRIQNNQIEGNTAKHNGGGVYLELPYGDSPQVLNNVIEGNSARRGAGIALIHRGECLVVNNTISANSATDGRAGVYLAWGAHIIVHNTIMWGNNPDEIGKQSGGHADVSYSDIQGGWPGEGNMNADPLFVDPDNGNYRLKAGSPCINTGNPDGAPSTDQEGNARDELPDIGAYEYQDLTLSGDVNRDGMVDVSDLVIIGQHFGESPPTDARADVNQDGVVDISDLVLVGLHFGEGQTPAAPGLTKLSKEQRLLLQSLYQEIEAYPAQNPQVEALKRLLANLLALPAPKTELFANYPNPFNPETWIPYQLTNDADVTLTIYNVAGQVVRMLYLGRQTAGYYLSRDKAAYWDGRNDAGERVANGVYFYRLQTETFSATRRMVILK